MTVRSTPIALVFLLCSLPLGLFGQTFTLTGTAVSSNADEKMSSASVAVFSLPDSTFLNGAITDEQGAFKIELNTRLDFYLTIRSMGYAPYTSEAFSPPDKRRLDLGELKVSAEDIEMEGVDIIGRIQKTISDGEKQTFRADQYQNATGGTADELVRNLPSVSQDGDGQFRLRGADDFLLLLNGNPVQGNASMLLSQLPADAIKDIEIITSPGAKYDTDGAGGIINIITKQPITEGVSGTVGLQGGLPSTQTFGNLNYPLRFGGNSSVGYRKEKFDIALSGNYYRKDLAGYRELEAFTQRGDSVRTYLPSEGERSFIRSEYGARLSMNYRPSDRHSFALNANANFKRQKRRADLVFENERENLNTDTRFGAFSFFNNNFEWRNGDFYLVNLDYNYNIDSTSQLRFSGLYEYSFFNGPTENREFASRENDQLLNFVDNVNDSPLNGIRLRLDYNKQFDKFGIQTGIQYRRIDSEVDFQYNELATDFNDVPAPNGAFFRNPNFSNFVIFSRDMFSGYVQGNTQIGELNIQAGLRAEQAYRRLDHDGISGTLEFDLLSFFPSVNLTYPLSKNLKLKTAYSRRIDRNTIYQLNPFPEREHSYVLEQGDDNLRPEISELAELGVILDDDRGTLAANLFFRHTRNQINRFNTRFNDTIVNRFYSNVGTGTSLGLDVNWNWRVTDWFDFTLGGVFYQYWLNGSYTVDGEAFEANADAFQFSTNPSLNFKLPADIRLQTGVNYLSKRVTAQGEDGAFYTPFLSLKKSFFDNRFSVQFQWLYIDLGLLNTHEQRITNRGEDFFTSVNYIYETDVLMLNLNYTFREGIKRTKFKESEILEREF